MYVRPNPDVYNRKTFLSCYYWDLCSEPSDEPS
jgi:hypothetical protein